MKKITLIKLFIVLVGILFVSCKTDINQPVVSSNPTDPVIADASYSGEFNIDNADSLITYSWSAADFGFESSITYSVQISSTSDFSGKVSALFSTQNLSGTAKVKDVNAAILSWGFAFGTPVTVYYRVGASVSSHLAAAYSETKSTDLTPYEDVPTYPMVYVPGSYQGWSPGGDDYSRLYSYNSNSVYESIIRLVNSDTSNHVVEFKITPAPNWDNDWGGSLTKIDEDYSGTLVPKGDNLKASDATYAFNVDINALTITLTKTYDWGLIGSATPDGWNSDQNMFYNGQRKMWEITLNLVAGEIKFRADNSWTVNYGGSDGTLTAGGANIPIDSDGNYTIRFDPVALTYTIQKN